jgi:uncharacterized cupin superfamily protein
VKRLTLGLLTAAMLTAAPLWAADGLKPTRVDKAQAAGPVFTSKGAVKDHGPDGPATDFNMLASTDKRFIAGLYKAGPSDQKIDAYPVDEFCYFLSGSVRLTSEDGTVLELQAGDAVTLPKGWKGRWQTSGYSKYYVVYDSASASKSAPAAK